jgi:hypothetical protein
MPGMAGAMHHAVSPDWSSIAEDVLCPLCEYNLRGVQEPRCPECGYQFAWSELLDPDRRRHEYLFEHHSTHRFRWFRKTLWGGLRPGKFWRSLHPVQLIYPRRLLLYALLVVLIYAGCVQVTGVAGLAGRVHGILALNGQRQAGRLPPLAPPGHVQRMVASYGSLDNYKAYLESMYPTHFSWSIVRACLPQWLHYVLPSMQVLLGILVWPVLSFLALLVFQISMRRARIRSAHVLRCVVYSFDALVWTGPASVLLAGASMLAAPYAGYDMIAWLALLVGVVMIGHILYRLFQSYRLYLRFDHPILTVLASQVIAGLAILKIVAMFTIDRRH